jgi:integrase/recombinase XerD
MLTPIKSFFKWLTQENYLLYNPASELVLPKKPKALPRVVLSVEQVLHILEQPDINTASGLRDRAILEVLYATGIRRAELTQLYHYDIDQARQTVLVREGKYNKDRYLPLGARAFQWVNRYRFEVRDSLLLDHKEPHLFLTDYGEPFNGSYLGALVKRYIAQAEIKVTGSCHLLRHAMATHMLENGADIRYIQSMLGHSDLSTTEIYTRVSIEKLQQIHAATHPAKLNDTKPTSSTD